MFVFSSVIKWFLNECLSIICSKHNIHFLIVAVFWSHFFKVRVEILLWNVRFIFCLQSYLEVQFFKIIQTWFLEETIQRSHMKLCSNLSSVVYTYSIGFIRFLSFSRWFFFLYCTIIYLPPSVWAKIWYL